MFMKVSNWNSLLPTVTDEIINKIYNELLKVYGKLTAIYTGSSASWVS